LIYFGKILARAGVGKSWHPKATISEVLQLRAKVRFDASKMQYSMG